MASKQFFEALKARRSIYQISAKSTVSDARLTEIINQAVLHTPSSFNMQAGRVLLLLKEAHVKLWDQTANILQAIVPPETFAATETKLKGFKAGYGTVLFFEDQGPVKAMQDKFPLYQDKFPDWSQHSSGMLQIAVWTALELEGMGASLQHYNPLIDEKVRSEWDLPEGWKLISQMPFGVPVGAPNEKTYMPLEERVKVASQ